MPALPFLLYRQTVLILLPASQPAAVQLPAMQSLQCGRSTAARDQSGNTIPVGRGSKCSVTELARARIQCTKRGSN